MTRNRRIRRCALLTLLVGLGWASIAGATAGDDVADRQLGQSSFFNRSPNLVDARGLSSPLDVAIDRSVTPNRLYVADYQNSRVLGWSDAGGFATGAPADLVIGQPDFVSSDCLQPSTAASLCAPQAVAVDGFGNLYVADTGNNRVLEYDTPFTSDAVADVVFGQDGDFTSVTCNGPPNGLCSPIAIELDLANNLYVIDANNQRVLVYGKPVLFEDYDPDLVIPTDCGAAVSATSLCSPQALAVDAAGNLYIADGRHRVLEYDAPLANGTTADRVFGQGNDFTTSACNAGGLSADSLCSPRGLAVTDDGSLLVTDGSNTRILFYDTPILGDTTADRVFGQGGVFTTDTLHCNDSGPGPTSSGFCAPSGLAIDADGRVYVADIENHRVLAFDAAGTGDPVASRVLGQTSFANGGQNLVDARGFYGPAGLAIDRSATPARLYVADQGNHRVLAWADAAGFANGAPADLVIGQPDFAASSGCRFPVSALDLCLPSGVAVDQAGNLYVADNDNSRVLEYDTPFSTDVVPDRVFGQNDDFTTETCSPTGLCKPRAVALDGAGNLYVADSQQNRVLEYDAPLATDTTPDRVFGQRGSFATTGCNQGGRDAGSLCDPAGVAVDANGNVYVADKNNSRILEYDLPLTTDVTADRVFGQQGSFTTADCNPVPGDPNTFCFPYGVATDAAGNLWIAYAADDRLVELDAPLTTGDAVVDRVFGEVGTGVRGCDLVGRGPRGLCGPSGAAVDATGNLYVADAGDNRVLSYDTPLPLTPGSSKAARKCQQTIVKASAAFVQAVTSTRRKCEEGKVKGTIAACPDAKTTTALGKLRTKLTGTITKACCGKDKQCTGGGDDQTLVDIGWNVGGCPTFIHGGCANRIAGAADVATCLACLGEATVGDVLGRTYGSLLPSNPKTQKALNSCQLAIGKGATTFAAVKSKALAKCWDTVSKGKAAGPCPDAGAATKIAAARAKAIDKTCKGCGGGGDKAPADGHCDAASTLDPQTDIGFPEGCPGNGGPTAGPVDCGDFAAETVDDLVACVDCMTNETADCADRGAVPAFASYPIECRP